MSFKFVIVTFTKLFLIFKLCFFFNYFKRKMMPFIENHMQVLLTPFGSPGNALSSFSDRSSDRPNQ